LAYARQQAVGGRGLLRELPQVHPAGLVRAVLAPHDRVHRQLGLGRAAAQDLPDPQVLVLQQAQLRVRLGDLGGGQGVPDGVDHADVGGDGHAGVPARCLTSEVKNVSPSVEGPVSASTACSGWGMIPTTLPASLLTAAMSRAEPFGLPLVYRATTRPVASSSSRVASSAT